MIATALPSIALLILAQASPTLSKAPASGAPAEVRKAFLDLLDRPRVSLDAKVDSTVRNGGLVVENLSFTSEQRGDGTLERVPALLVRPAAGEGRRPVVIALHGTGGSKEGMRSWLDDLARRGIVGLAIDARYHGARSGGAKGAAAYNEAIVRAWKSPKELPQEHPFYFDTCWDLWRTVDYLASRDDIDPRRIGMMGISMGGIETWLAASTDERVAVAVPAIGVQSFRWSLENGQWQGRARTIAPAHEAAARDLDQPRVNARVCRTLWSKVIPGILGPFDCPSMIRLFAGRPLLILNGELDPNCPIGGARVAFEAAEAAYRAAGASDRLKIDVAKGVGHAVTDDQRKEALGWFERWLKP